MAFHLRRRLLAGCFCGALAACSSSSAPGDAGLTQGPVLEASAASLDFGPVTVGATAARDLTLTNTGAKASRLTLALQLVAGADPGFAVDWIPAGPAQGLGAGESATLRVSFTPAAEGAARARLTLSTSDPARPTLEVPLAGSGAPSCEYEVVPSELLFGKVALGESLVRPLILRNRRSEAGAPACTFTDLQVAESAEGAFTLPDGPLAQFTLAAGEQREVPVRFQPTAYGLAAGTVRFSATSAQQPQGQVALSGAAPAPCLKSTPQGQDFGPVGVGCRSRERAFVVTNTCADPQTLRSIDLVPGTSPEFQLTRQPTLPLVLPAAGSAELAATYRPTAVGADEGAIGVTTAEGAAPYRVPLKGRGDEAPSLTESLLMPATPGVDVLFVVDDSSSMAPKQDAVLANLGYVFDLLSAQGVDFRLAVTTTSVDLAHGGRSDAGGPNENGCLVPLGAGTRVVGPETPSGRATFLKSVQVGGAGNEEELLLRPAVLALTAPNLDGCAAGFLREEALLDVVVISDAVDSDPVPVADYSATLRGLKGAGREQDVAVHAVGPWGTATARCTPEEIAGPTDRLEQLALATGGVRADVCDEEWGRALAPLAERALARRLQLPLADLPDPAFPMVLTVDGAELAASGPYGDTRWTYAATTNRIVFDTLWAPEPGAILTVTYRLACRP